MARETVTTWAQRSVATGALFLVATQLASLLSAPRRAFVVLALYGFVLHVVFGKAYSLVPSYFDRQLTVGWLPAVQLPLTAAGSVVLAVDAWVGVDGLDAVGAVLWAAGVAAFLAAVGWTIRDNLSGAETATSDANADRQPVDRVANAFMPVALAYLAVGAWVALAPAVGLPAPLDAYPPRATHLLAAGTGALLVFSIGFRLLPRFMVASPPRGAVYAVLLPGAVGPVLIAAGVTGGPLLHAGAVLEALAVVAFAGTVSVLFVRSDRRRVGFYGVLAGAAAGVAAVAFGLWFALVTVTPSLVAAHLRLTLVGFLGLTVVGVAYQFYPPNVGSRPANDDRTALASIGLLATGLAAEVVGHVIEFTLVASTGAVLELLGAVLFAYLVVGLLLERGKL